MMKKIIFLDIDGVLNSERYDRERTAQDGNIDESRLVLLKALADETGAEIVLISSWRKHWMPAGREPDAIGRELNRTFGKYGLAITDKTPVFASNDRADEISAWLAAHEGTVKSFVILDDRFGGWGALSSHLVATNMRIGRGLEEKHVRLAVEILKS